MIYKKNEISIGHRSRILFNPLLKTPSFKGYDELVVGLTPIMQLNFKLWVGGAYPVSNLIRCLIGYICTIEESNQLVLNKLFTQERAFVEMCRAAEGNARDMLVLFVKAHWRFCQQESHQRIGLDEVHNASTELYRGDKYSNIATEKHLEEFLEYLITSVIKEKKSRTFMVPFQQRNHPLLQRLYSARILHLLNYEWSHPHRPGERYSLVTMDYGTYVSFRGTKNEPQQKLFWPTDETQPPDLVPFDDRRSIRRIIVSEDVLEKFWNRRAETV